MNQQPAPAMPIHVIVESYTGRRYFIPREAVERLFLLCPDQAATLVAQVTTACETPGTSDLPVRGA